MRVRQCMHIHLLMALKQLSQNATGDKPEIIFSAETIDAGATLSRTGGQGACVYIHLLMAL